MGLSIGQASIAISTASTASANRPQRPEVTPNARVEERPIVERTDRPRPQVGFGENTLSPLSAALETIDSNLEAVEDVVPTVEELRERARVAQAEQRAELLEDRPVERPEELRRRETVRPESDPAVRNFITEPEATRPDTRLAAPEQPGQLPDLSLVEEVRPAPEPNSRIDFFA